MNSNLNAIARMFVRDLLQARKKYILSISDLSAEINFKLINTATYLFLSVI